MLDDSIDLEETKIPYNNISFVRIIRVYVKLNTTKKRGQYSMEQ
jgi:hypothetical protein